MPLLGFRRSGKNGSRLPIVSMKDGKVFANSRDVAAYFGKEHRNVLRDIDDLISAEPACALNFELTSAQVEMPRGGSRLVRTFDMTRDVADYFGKRHDNVLREVDALLDSGSSDLRDLFIEQTEYHEKARKSVRFFDMTRDGFTLLAMGFTGKQALQFKLQYIAAFNEMEKTVKATPAIPDFSDPVAAARAWADEMEAKCVTAKKTGPRLSSP